MSAKNAATAPATAPRIPGYPCRLRMPPTSWVFSVCDILTWKNKHTGEHKYNGSFRVSTCPLGTRRFSDVESTVICDVGSTSFDVLATLNQRYYVSPLTERWGHVALPLSTQFVRSAFVCAFPPIAQAVKHETLTKCWANAGLPSATLAQHQTSTGWTLRVCWVNISPV